MFHSRVEFCGGLFICGRDIKLIYRRIAQSALSILLQYNLLNYILYCKTGTNICIWGHLLILLKSSYINIIPLEASEFLCELNQLMYFYWKISYFGNFLYTAPGQPGVQDFIRGAGPPGPTLAIALSQGRN